MKVIPFAFARIFNGFGSRAPDLIQFLQLFPRISNGPDGVGSRASDLIPKDLKLIPLAIPKGLECPWLQDSRPYYRGLEINSSSYSQGFSMASVSLNFPEVCIAIYRSS